MKKILLITALTAALVANVCSASMGTILPGAAPAKITNSKDNEFAVTLQNNDSVPVYITAYEESGDIPWLSYSTLPSGTFNIPFNSPYTLNLQYSCTVGNSAMPPVGVIKVNGGTFTIPAGACSNHNLLLKK